MSFDSLPAEILQNIFEYLPLDEQLEKTSISHRWNRLTLREIYLFLANGGYVISKKILRRTKRGYCCFSIEFRKSYRELRPLLQICARKFFLRKLILDRIPADALVLFTQDYREWLRSVVCLSVAVNGQDEAGNAEQQLDLPLLKVLSWTCGVGEDTSSVTPKYVLNAPALEDAYIEWDRNSDQPPVVLKDTTKLKTLGIFVPNLLSTVCPNGLPALDCLKVYDSPRPLQWNMKLSDLSRLTTLKLYGCIVTSATIASMRHFPNLRNLIIHSEPNNEINLHHIAHAMPRLYQLRLFDSRVTFNAAVLTFPHLQILDLNDVIPDGPVGHWPLEINAPYLMTFKGASHNLIGLKTIQPTVRLLILQSLYLNLSQPRQWESVMILHLDISCRGERPPRVTECIHQFPNLFRLTLILHDKQGPVGLNGHLLAVSFRLSYLHLQNFDLDYDFLVGINNLHLVTLALQDGTLHMAPDDGPLFIQHCYHMYLKNVLVPSDVLALPLHAVNAKMVGTYPEGNLFSTLLWDERRIKSAEDYVKYLLWA